MFGGSLSAKSGSLFNRKRLVGAVLLATLGFFTFQIARITAAYIPYNTDVGFLQIKQEYIDIDVWRTAFFVHVYASIWVLIAGFTQFSSFFRDFYPRVHRSIGYFYVVNILLITGPASLIMAFYANGGIYSKIAFITLAILWLYTTAMALIKAKNGDYGGHRDFMIRSFALTLSALTLRAWKWGINNSVDGLPPMDVYRVVAWLGWVPNLVIAEYLVRRSHSAKARA